MTEFVLSLRPSLLSAGNEARSESGISREVLVLGAILATFQVMDGILTYMGVQRFGIGAEANLFIRSMMEQIGAGWALFFLKGIAVAIVGILCGLAARVAWLPMAMRGMIAVYLFAAILPWTAILLSRGA